MSVNAKTWKDTKNLKNQIIFILNYQRLYDECNLDKGYIRGLSFNELHRVLIKLSGELLDSNSVKKPIKELKMDTTVIYEGNLLDKTEIKLTDSAVLCDERILKLYVDYQTEIEDTIRRAMEATEEDAQSPSES